MAHTVREKTKLLARVRRIRGQVDGVERLIADERDCGAILHSIAACRGALNGLMSEVVEGHILEHVRGPRDKSTAKAAQDLIDVVRTYLR